MGRSGRSAAPGLPCLFARQIRKNAQKIGRQSALPVGIGRTGSGGRLIKRWRFSPFVRRSTSGTEIEIGCPR
jgi:hypothetical protein